MLSKCLANFLARGRDITKYYLEMTATNLAQLERDGNFYATREAAEVLD